MRYPNFGFADSTSQTGVTDMTFAASSFTSTDDPVHVPVAGPEFDWACDEPIDEFEPPSFDALNAFFLEMSYDRLTEGYDTSESLREPLTVSTMSTALRGWLPANHASRFIAGTLLCNVFDNSSHPLHFAELSKMHEIKIFLIQFGRFTE